MTYKVMTLYRCDGCGLEVKQERLGAPTGWLEPAGLSQQAGPHLCQNCVRQAQELPSGIVPVETKVQVA